MTPEEMLRAMRPNTALSTAEGRLPASPEVLKRQENPLRGDSIFLGETVDSPMPPSIEIQILVELRMHTVLLRQIKNLHLGKDLGINHESEVNSAGTT